MRLTLRTLLAYLDDILEPQDAEDIGKRIQESEVASALMHRIRDVMRRLRLQAPNVDDAGKGLDANTVAEYLDHVLPDDRVPDFERICLESDVHLAEVASCHQVLALVLGEPAEVEPAMREHMYTLPQVATELEAMEARAGEEGVTGDGRNVPVPPPPPRRPRPVVPDYLRGESGKRRRMPWAAALVLTVGLIAVGAVIANHYGLLGGRQGEVALQGDQAGKPKAVPEEEQPAPTPDEPLRPSTAPSVPPGQEPTALPPGPAASPTAPAEPGAAAPPIAPAPGGPAAAGVTTPQAVPPAAQLPAAELPVPPVPADQQPTGPIEQPPAAPAPGGPSETVAPPAPGNVPPPATPAEPPVTPPAAPAAPAPEHLGRFVSDVSEHELLLQYDPQSQSWSRLPSQGVLGSGRDLLAPPAFRALVVLASGLTVQLREGTQVGLQTIEGHETPRVELRFGRMVASRVGKPDTRLPLSLGNQSGTLVFVDPESRAAVEMIRAIAPGTDPEKATADQIVYIYALGGSLVWESDDGASKVEFKAMSRLALGPTGVGPAESIEQAELPKWHSAGKLDLDRLASKTVEEAVQVDRPVTLALKELLGHRKKEVRWLACRSLGYVGDFEPMVAALNDPEYRLLWDDYVAELREGLARGPAVAAQVRSALNAAYGASGDRVYRMLWGYNDVQLSRGEDQELVSSLSADLLAVRVVGLWNLNQITGARLFYRPDDTPARRERAVRAWEKRLKDKEIRTKPAAAGGAARPAAPAVVAPAAPVPVEPAPIAPSPVAPSP